MENDSLLTKINRIGLTKTAIAREVGESRQYLEFVLTRQNGESKKKNVAKIIKALKTINNKIALQIKELENQPSSK